MATEAAPFSRRLKLTAPGEKLLVPASFDRVKDLVGVNLHSYATSADVKDLLDADVKQEWASVNVAYALLVNGELFWVDIHDEARFHGGCAVVRTSQFSQDISLPLGYCPAGGDEDKAREKKIKNPKSEVRPGVPNTPVLRRFDACGTTWTRRRYTLASDETYSFVQWRNTKALKLKEKPFAANLTDVATLVQSLDESFKSMQKDVREMKTELQHYTTLSSASLALAESLKQVLKEQSRPRAGDDGDYRN